MHDWTRVSGGTFHDFHNAWITHLKEALNAGLLPPSYYALGEQLTGDFGPDVVTLRADAESDATSARAPAEGEEGLVAVATVPPQVRLLQEAVEETQFFLKRQRSVAIRHTSGDRVVAIIEIVSRANHHSRSTLEDFVDKVVAAIQQQIHVVIVDPFPSGPHAPNGIHGLVWDTLLAGDYRADQEWPLTLVSYQATRPTKAWIQPLRVGEVLTPMPLFLTADHYISLPLEETYAQAWAGVPGRWKRVIEAIDETS